LNENEQQIDFSQANLTASGYANLTIGILIEENKSSWIISCDPYLSEGICSIKEYRLESRREYSIAAKLKNTLTKFSWSKIWNVFH